MSAPAASSGQPSSAGPIKGTGVKFPFCPEIGKYERLAKVGQGTFG